MRTKLMLVTALIAAVAITSTAKAERAVLETILVRVNDRIVTVNDFKIRLRQELSQMSPMPQGKDLREFTEGLFETMVDEMLLLERAGDRRITIDESTVDSAIENLRVENDLTDEAAFEAALESSGMTLDDLRERYRQTILLSRTVQSQIRPTEITEEEVRMRYEEEKELYKLPEKVSLQQLFFPIAEDGSNEDEVIRVANGLVKRVSEGSDLQAEATLAGIEVQDLGAIPVADLRSDLLRALDGVPEGGFTDPLVTAGGVQVIHLMERIPEGYQSFEEVKPSIERRMSATSYQDQSREFVEGLREEYLVVIDQKQLDSILDTVESL